MIGPARKEDKENVVKEHGLLLAPAHLPIAARQRYHQRVKRDSNKDFLEQFRGWPMEFDHLLMSAEPSIFNSEKNQTVNNGKIHIHKLSDLSNSTTITNLR